MRSIIFYFFSLIISLGCHKQETTQTKPLVLVSLSPYAFIVEELGKDFVEVATLIPEGANPHIYEAPPKAIEKHKKAVLWIYAGEAFDQKFKRFLDSINAPLELIDIAEGIEPIYLGSDRKSIDRHTWLSPRIFLSQVDLVADKLISLLPEKSAIISERKDLLKERLKTLDSHVSSLLEAKKGSAFITSHSAFAYFCRDYGLTELSIEVDGKDPLPHTMQKLLDQAKELCIQTIIIEPQHSSKGAEVMSSLLGVPIQSVNPYAKDYESTLIHLAQVIADAS